MFVFNSHAVDELGFKLGSIEADQFNIGNSELSIRLLDKQHLQFQLRSDNIQSPHLNDEFSLAINCDKASFNNETIDCSEGKLNIQHPLSGNQSTPFTFQYQLNNGFVSFQMSAFEFAEGQISIQAKKQKQHWQYDIDLKKIALPTLLSALNTEDSLLNEYPIDAGLIDGTVQLGMLNGQIKKASFDANISALNMDANQVLEDVSLSFTSVLERTGKLWHMKSDASLAKGVLYLTPGFQVFEAAPGFYLDLNSEKLNVNFDLAYNPETQSVVFDTFHYDHGNLVAINGNGELILAETLAVDVLTLSVSSPDISKVFPVYVQPILLPTNFADLELSGGMSVNLFHRQNQLQTLNLVLDDIYIDDEFNRFSLNGLNSNIKLDESSIIQTSTIQWQGISVYKLLFGAGDMVFESVGTDYEVKQWQNVTLLDGELAINKLTLDNIGSAEFEMYLDGELKPISLTSFTQTMDWPLMSGDLAGEINGLNYSNNTLSLDGDLLFRVFNGNVTLRGLTIENLFSNFSRLKTDIDIENIDLEQLTNTFTFGKIEGTIEGRMHKFVLEDWQPVRFDAEFSTPKEDDKPHRISQKALDNLSELGSGLSGSLSRGFLKFVPEYSYGRLGLSCRLKNGICNLGGVEKTDDGFYILTRGGLLPPWVAVKGTGRSITWDDLIGGFQQIAEGEIAIE